MPSDETLMIPKYKELYRLWPKSNHDVGHYSRKLQNIEEAKVLYNFLFHHAVVSNPLNRWKCY